MKKGVLLPNGEILSCRELQAEDKEMVLKLFHTAKDYFMLPEGKFPENAEDFFTDLPSSKQPGDKILYGNFEGDTSVTSSGTSPIKSPG